MAGVRTHVPFALGPLEMTASGSMDRIASPVGIRTPFTFDAALALPIKSAGFWFGSGMEGAPEIESARVRALVRGGLWQTFRAVRVSVEASSHSARLNRTKSFLNPPIDPSGDTVWVDGVKAFKLEPGRDTSTDSERHSDVVGWSDVEGRVAWRAGSATFEAVVGGRARVGAFQPALWSRLGVAYWMSERFALSVAAGNDPPRLALGIPGTRFASFALRVNPWGQPKAAAVGRLSAFTVQSAGLSTYRITYLAPNASSVELSGDFDKWRPVSLVQTRSGVWEATIPLVPGTYRVNVRVNGERWVAPAGLPQAEDDFNGTVGILVVR